MTNYVNYVTMGPIAPLVSKDKGSLGNRVNCIGAQTANVIATGATVAGVTAGACYAAKNQEQVTKLLKQGKNIASKIANSKVWQHTKNATKKIKNSAVTEKVAQWLEKFNNTNFNKICVKAVRKLKDITDKAFEITGKLPKGGKVALSATIGLILLKSLYKSGQIDQKYTDRAQMEKNMV